MFSAYLKLNVFDVLKGFVVSIITAVLVLINSTITSGSFEFNWTTIWQTSLTAGVAYLVKNFFTNSNGTLGASNPS